MMTRLVKYDAACRALAEAHSVDEVKSIRDKAVAMQAYAKQAKDTTLISQATEIRMRAERRAGELLRDMATRGERAVRKNMKSQGATSKLADLGVTKTQSSRWQQLAALSADKFERNVHAGEHRRLQSDDGALCQRRQDRTCARTSRQNDRTWLHRGRPRRRGRNRQAILGDLCRSAVGVQHVGRNNRQELFRHPTTIITPTISMRS